MASFDRIRRAPYTAVAFCSVLCPAPRGICSHGRHNIGWTYWEDIAYPEPVVRMRPPPLWKEII